MSPLLSVRDVEASSTWYQRVLQLESTHGGREYDRLERAGAVVLHLHRWGVEHHHGPFGDVEDKPYGNGVALWVETEDFDATAARAEAIGANIAKQRGPGGNTNWELWLRDPDGYLVVVESPHNSAAQAP
jgi:catechol 2,3-dioxygenase-like lactoylglutathione lyase family enzyme